MIPDYVKRTGPSDEYQKMLSQFTESEIHRHIKGAAQATEEERLALNALMGNARRDHVNWEAEYRRKTIEVDAAKINSDLWRGLFWAAIVAIVMLSLLVINLNVENGRLHDELSRQRGIMVQPLGGEHDEH